MKKIYSFMMVLVVALLSFAASSAKTVTVKCDQPENVMLRDGGADGEILSFTEDGQEVTILGDALYVTSASDAAILSQVTYTSPAGYNAWGSIVSGACLIQVADMSVDNTTVYVTLATPLSLYINVEDPEVITLSESLSGKAFDLTAGFNEVKVAPYTNLTLAVNNPNEYKLTEVWTSGNPDKKLKINSFTSCSIGSYDYQSGDQIEYIIVPASDFDVPSFTLNIDDPTKVNVSVDYQPLEGLSTQNIIDMSGDTATVSITTKEYGATIYRVSLNGVVQTSYNNASFFVTVKPEDELTVTYNYPDVDFDFTAYTVPDTDSDLVTVKIGDEPYELGTLASAKAGTKVEVVFDTQRASVASVLKNGSPVSTYDLSSLLLVENTTLEIVMNRFQELPIVININNPEGVKAQISYSTVELKAGRNDLTFTKKDYGNSLTLVATPGYVINSVESTLNGEHKEYEPSYGSYTVDLDGDMVIDINVEPLVKDTKAVVYSSFAKENDIFYNGHCTFQSDYDNESFNFDEGYNEIEFNNLQSTFMLTGFMADFTTPEFYVYLNHELQTPSYGSYYLVLDNNSVLKLFLNEEPKSYKADFKVADDVNVEVISNLVEVVDPAVGVDDLQGTLIQVRNTGAKGSVSVSTFTLDQNENVVSADADGIFNIVLDSDMTIQISGETSGVDSIGGENEGAAVFTPSGVYVGNTTENLPAGIYIVNGRKIVVR